MGTTGRGRPAPREGRNLTATPPVAGGSQIHAQVLVDYPARDIDRPFTYGIPPRLRSKITIGTRVLLPFGRQKVAGDVIGFTSEAPAAKLRDILGVLVETPVFDEEQLELARWVAQRYCCPLREALRCLIAPGSSRSRLITVVLTEKGQKAAAAQELARAPRQAQLLSSLQAAGGEMDLDNLVQAVGQRGSAGASRSAVVSAVRGLEKKGLLARQSSLGRPTARQLIQLVAELADGEESWPQVIEALAHRAPRQAEVLTALVEAGGALPVAELPRSAVTALAEKGLVRVSEQRMHRVPDEPGLGNADKDPLVPTGAQSSILEHIYAGLAAGRHDALLLHGVTASGKTEVYLQAIAAAVAQQRSAIVLVPEIALTPQMVGRFRARFGNRLALLHSALSAGERYDEWDRIRRGEADIVIGARSAVFAPCRDVGVIVVDEEHERAYKQESAPRYLATAVAAERARRGKAGLVMGSATPSVENYYRAVSADESLSLMTLPERIEDRPMPPVEIIDLRGETLMGKGGTFSQMMLEAIEDRLTRGEQVILFLNRRGFSTFVMCRECGHVLRCPDCAVSLTYHHVNRTMRCHHCDYHVPVPELCPNCQGYDIGFHGLGTERVADQMEREFDRAVVARMDRDTVRRKGAHGRILRSFAQGEANILVGTQMIAKGLDLANVTLVGVLNADVGLYHPDFRAAEHTFQLLTQVAGRAGRADKPGEVLVQTYNPDHYAIVNAQHHDYLSFYEHEIAARRQNLYPPFVELANVLFSGADDSQALNVARRAAVLLQEMGVFSKQGDVQFLGPAPAPLHKLRGRYRYQMLLKARDMMVLRQTVERLREALGDTGPIQVIYDIEPMDMM